MCLHTGLLPAGGVARFDREELDSTSVGLRDGGRPVVAWNFVLEIHYASVDDEASGSDAAHADRRRMASNDDPAPGMEGAGNELASSAAGEGMGTEASAASDRAAVGAPVLDRAEECHGCSESIDTDTGVRAGHPPHTCDSGAGIIHAVAARRHSAGRRAAAAAAAAERMRHWLTFDHSVEAVRLLAVPG